MKSQLLLLAILLVVVGISSCNPEKGNPINSGNKVLTTTTTIAGVVTDNDSPMKGITVTAHGRSTTTDEHGFYIFHNISVPEDRCIVKVEQQGYFPASRMSAPKTGGLTHVHIGLLQDNAIYSIQTWHGGTITTPEGSRIEMPISGTDGYIPVGADSPYMDQVKVAAHWLFPVQTGSVPSFQLYSPGNLAARRTDSSTTFLYSYGVMSMAMYMNNGGKLQFGGGKKATLKCHISPSMVKDAPAEIPMWYFDEKISMWQEEGKAVKQGEDYVGEIAHTGQWNIASPVPTAVIKGQVKCGADVMSFVYINIGQYETWTDDNGNYECRVPAGAPLEVLIEPSKNLGSSTDQKILVEPLLEGQVLIRDIMVQPCTAYITGTIVDCNNKPIEGYVEAGLGNRFSYTVSDAKGIFKLRISPNEKVTAVRVTAFDGRNRPILQTSIPNGTVKDIGNVSLCPDDPPAFSTISFDATGYNVISLSDDGTRVIVGGKEDVRVFDTKTGQLLRAFSFKDCDRVQISPDKTQCLGSQKLLYGSRSRTTVWDIASGDMLLTFLGSYPFFTPDSRSVIAKLDTLRGANMVVYSISTGQEERRFTIPVPSKTGYASGGQHIVDIVANGTKGIIEESWYDNRTNSMSNIIIFDTEKGTILNKRTEFGWVPGSSIRVAANGEILGMSVSSNPVVLFQIDEMIQMGGIYAINYLNYAISPDAKYVAAQKNIGEPIQISDIMPNGPVLNRYLEMPEATTINSLVYSLDGKTLAGLWSGGIIIWRL